MSMSPTDPTSIYSLYQNTLREITASTKAWGTFLRAAARLYKYSFIDQVLIYAQRPEATACAAYDLWQDRLRRYVVHGSRGIALLDDSVRSGIRHVFDVADTRPLVKGTPEPYLWQVARENVDAVLSELGTGGNDLAEALIATVDVAAGERLDAYTQDFLRNREGSLWEELDEHSATVFFRTAVNTSVAWIVLVRCGIEPDAYIDIQELAPVLDCNMPGTINCLGVAISGIAGAALRHVETIVKNNNQNRISEGSTDYGRNIQASRRFSSTQSDSRGRGSGKLRQVRDAAEQLSIRIPTGDVYDNENPGDAGGAPARDRSNGAGAGLPPAGGDEAGGGRDRGAEGPRHDGLGGHGEQPEAAGRGASPAGSDLQLNLGGAEGDSSSDLFSYTSRSASLPAPAAQPQNFHITDDDLGVGGPKAKFAANVAAIETLKRVEAEGRPATPEEQETISRYVGWGGLQEAFDSRKQNWSREYALLKTLLTPEEYKSAMESVLNAHYTCPQVIKAIYQWAENVGFRHGNILEPSMGVGNFFGLRPECMSGSRLYGCELDSITGRMATLLYPSAHIQVNGFERTDWPDNFFDLAVGNVPFGDYHVPDPRYDRLKLHIHDYFFIKSIDQVRPGGIIAFITSRYTMDKKSTTVRRLMAQRCNLLGAVRLPNTAFKANAGTEVTADILFLQKRERPLDIESEWVQVGQTDGGFTVNQYFIDHPEMILGQLTCDNSHRMYGNSNTIACEPFPDSDLGVLLAGAVSAIPLAAPLVGPAHGLEAGDGVSADSPVPADPDTRKFSFTSLSGRLYYREDDQMLPVETSKTGANRIRGMIVLRDAVRRVIDAQMDGCDNDTLNALQQRLGTAYDRYTAQYGLLNSRGNEMAFSDDAGYPLLCALEVLDEGGKLLRKADMFTKRTIKQWSPPELVDTAAEALGVSIGTFARVDLPFMARLLAGSADTEAVIRDLRGQIFRDPEAAGDNMSGWQTADEYLSGNVRKKLAAARAAEEREPGRYESNVAYLTEAQPKDLEAQEIGVKLGSTWVPDGDVQQFVYDLLDVPRSLQKEIHVTYWSGTDKWNVSGKSYDRSGVKANVTYGTKRVNAYELIQSSLNLKDFRVYDTKEVDGKPVQVLNGRETTLAQQKQSIIQTAFREWLWRDPDRRQRLVRVYNDTFNCVRPRTYDGSHLQLVGMNPEIKLEKHQLDGVARIVYGGNTLLAHCVGAGKTWTYAAAAMEMKRLGLCHKSLLVVPSHLTGQVGTEFLQLYPAAKLLVATKKDFETQNRKKFCARITTGDYDAVVIGHSQFEKIPMSQERQQAQLKAQIADIEFSIGQLKAEKGENFTIKQMVGMRKGLEEKLKKLLSTERKDNTVTYEELGTDRLFVDEADEFKNLFLFTKMRNVAGIGQADAQKSSDLYMKCRYMDELTALTPGGPGRGVIFGTGTPVSNSLTELYTMMRYLQSAMLKEKGLSSFDAWASIFGETVTALELKPEGTGYRIKTRFSRFANVPELMNLWREVTDIRTAEMLKLPVPEAHYHIVSSKPSLLQQEMVRALSERADKVRSGSVDPGVDNMLCITNDGRKLALDQRVINQSYLDEADSKVNLCVDNVYRIWRETADNCGAQLIFSDLATPRGRVELVEQEDGSFARAGASRVFCVYDDIRDKLVARGVPENEIAFIHDYNTDARKSELFSAVRSGRVRILLGSTRKMGAGTNVQTRLKALHDLDVPWRPRDLEQRMGRIVRRGNQYPEVDLYRYVTEGTFDAYSYQTVEGKQRFISQIMCGKNTARTCEDIDATALSYAEIKALCAGDPKIKLKMDLDVEVARLETLRAGYLSEHYRLEDALTQEYPRQLQEFAAKISALEADTAILDAHPAQNGDDFIMEVGGVVYHNKEAAGTALIDSAKALRGGEWTPTGWYRGFPLELRRHVNLFKTEGNGYTVALVGRSERSGLELGADPLGNIARLNNALDGIYKNLSWCRDQLQPTREKIAVAEEELKKPWPLEAEWREKSGQLAALNAELNAESQAEPLAEAASPPSRDVEPWSSGVEDKFEL